jgi:hypothetical protein
MDYEHGLIAPVLALVLWSFVVWIWLYATRIPAMQKAKIQPQEGALAGAMNARMPANARQVADNYNHLMEQPTIFYAAAFAAQLGGAADATNIGLAWGYVALRVVHSVVQCTFNNVMLRFLIFLIGTIALAAMAVRTAVAIWA